MGDAGYRVEIAGLRELRRALNLVDKQFGKELAEANNQAAEIVAAEARRRAPSGPHQGGGTVVPIAASIRALRGQRRAAVSMGGAKTPHAEPTEFGGTIPRHHSLAHTHIQQRAFLYPAIAAKRAEVVQTYAYLVDRLTSRAFNQ